jgi:broad specificity phosphatase PhoE
MGLEHIDAIYTSPMKRAMQTAAPLAQLKNMQPIVVDGVAE